MRTNDVSLSKRITCNKDGMRIWQQERAKFEVTERLCELMATQNISRSELAELAGISKSFVTHLLGGSANMTINTISDLYLALGRQFHPEDGPIEIDNVSGPTVIRFNIVETNGFVRESPVQSVEVKVN